MPTRDFKPTHKLDDVTHERHGQPCKVLAGTNYTGGEAYRDIVFRDGYKRTVNIKKLTPLASSLGITTKDLEEYQRNYKPDHYHSGGIDPWQFIEANMNPQQAIGFHLGNVLKYVARHEKKNGLEDLKKALDSLREGIRLYEKAESDRRTVCDSEDESNNT